MMLDSVTMFDDGEVDDDEEIYSQKKQRNQRRAHLLSKIPVL